MLADIYLNPNFDEFLEFAVTFKGYEEGSSVTINGRLPYTDEPLETLRLKSKEKARVILKALANDRDF
jgi:hypothetical protein